MLRRQAKEVLQPRAGRRGDQHEELHEEEGETPDQAVLGTENPDRMHVVDRIALDNAIAQLPRGYRTVFVLHDVEGYEHEEIGRMLGISDGTVRWHLHTARATLRAALAPFRRKTDD